MPSSAPTLLGPPWQDIRGYATVGFNITGGYGYDGLWATVNSKSDFEDWCSGNRRVVVQISGIIDLMGDTVYCGSDKTLLGIGTDAQIINGIIIFKTVSNIIVQNIDFAFSVEDSIQITDRSEYIWIDHCSFHDSVDGLIDIKYASTFITISWSHFYSHHNMCLVGHSDSQTSDEAIRVTFHHNWFQADARGPRVRFGHVHSYNNFYEMDTGIASFMRAQVVSEKNFFNGGSRPIMVDNPGSTPEPGEAISIGDVFTNNDQGPETRGDAFDPTADYVAEKDDVYSVPGLVMAYAGAGKRHTLAYVPYLPTYQPTTS